MRIPRPKFSLRWSLVGVAAVALTIWLGLAIFRPVEYMLAVHVTNNSSYPLQIVDYDAYSRPANPHPLWRRDPLIKSLPRDLFLSPGQDMMMLQFQDSEQSVVVFELWCKGEDGKIRSCGAEVPITNRSLTFLVGNSTIRVVVDGGP